MSEAWHVWKANPGRQTLKDLLHENDRIIQHAVHNMSASGVPRPALEAEARKLAIKAFKTYDPAKSQLHTHVTNHLKNLNRFVDKHSQNIRLPEEKARLSERVFKAMRELEESLGRRPTNQELSEFTGIGESNIGGLIRYQSRLYSQNEGAETFGQPIREDISHLDYAKELLYHTLPPQHKIVFQHTVGYNGHEILKNGEIAKMLKVSAARVSTIRKEIGKRMEDHLSGIDFFQS